MIFLPLFLLSAGEVNDTPDSIKKQPEPTIHSVVTDTTSHKNLVYVFDIKQQIAPAAWRNTQKAFEEAEKLKADYIIIHMNTYGGMVNMADSIRTRILNSSIPVFVFIDNNAASAGALISIAADSIYMRKGASIGAATVVNQSGEVVPDKYQSFMRATMRSTAESHGKDTIIAENDTIVEWHRDPKIAEAMVDPSIYIPGIIDTGKVLTFTTDEALQHGFAEGIAENINEVVELAGIENAIIQKYEPTGMEKMIGGLLSPILQGIFIMMIIGGIYFELQTPGVGFPLAIAITGAALYFAPLYLEGLAENWELIIFVLGLVLVAVEIFAIPGFGVAGITGIILIITGLILAMIDNVVFKFDSSEALSMVVRAFLIVVISSVTALILSIYLSKRLLTSGFLSQLALNTTEERNLGYISIDSTQKALIGKTGTAYTILRPSGKVEINGEIYDAVSEIGYIEKGTKIKVVRDVTMQLYVIKDTENV